MCLVSPFICVHFNFEQRCTPHLSQHPLKQVFRINQTNTPKIHNAFQPAVCDHDLSCKQDAELYCNRILKQSFAGIQM